MRTPAPSGTGSRECSEPRESAPPAVLEALAALDADTLNLFAVSDWTSRPPPVETSNLLRGFEDDRRILEGHATVLELSKILVTREFLQAPLPDVVSVLQELTQLNIMIDRRAIEGPDELILTWDARELPLRDLLEGLADRSGVGWLVDEGVVVITSPALARKAREEVAAAVAAASERLDRQRELLSRTVVLRGESLPPRAVAELLALWLGVPWDFIDLDWDSPPVFAFDGAESPAQAVADVLRNRAGVTTIYRDGVLWFVTR
ncbi:MAG: hypothetical protein IT452_16280 [Planctomycetia bacterium]|nr:hypothetical protein [Planctomycetia bacterium]